MPRLTISATADADTADVLKDIFREAGPDVAAKFNSRFESLFERLIDHPDSGPVRPKLGRNIRIGLVLPYVVIYRHIEDDDTVTILRVVHGRRRMTRKLLQDKS